MEYKVPAELWQLQTHLQATKASSQEAFAYNKNWSNIDHETVQEVLEMYPQKISRLQVIQLAQQYNQDDVSVTPLHIFIASMLWGYGDLGYGAYRTTKMLNAPHLAIILIQTLNFLSENNIRDAYSFFNDIKGLGQAFATKFLYFAGVGARMNHYPLILDSVVVNSLNNLLGSNSPKDSKIADYMRYVDMMHSWAVQLDCDADAIELLLFSNFSS